MNLKNINLKYTDKFFYKIINVNPGPDRSKLPCSAYSGTYRVQEVQ